MKSTRSIPRHDQSLLKLGKRSRSSLNYIAEGQENEEPSAKKRVSPELSSINLDDLIETNVSSSLRTSSTTITSVPIVSDHGPKKHHSLSLEVPPPPPLILLPQSLSPLIDWAPEDHEAYAWNIFDIKLREEQQYVLEAPVFDQIQTVVTPASHTCMFNFLCEVSQEQRLSYATFLHAMHIFDYVLSRMPVGRNDFLVTGCTCLMLACKLEEIYPPTSDSLMGHANFVFSKIEFYKSERAILEILDFKVARPTRLHFAQYLGKMQKISKRQAALLQYLVGLSVMDFDLNYLKASVVAAAALVVTFQLTNPSRDFACFTTQLAGYINGDVDEIQRAVAHIRYIHHFSQAGPDAQFSSTFSTLYMRRSNQQLSTVSTQHQKQGASSHRAMSPQLLDWFNTEEAFNVTDITALPLFDVDLSLLRNSCVRSHTTVLGTMATSSTTARPLVRTSPTNASQNTSSATNMARFANLAAQSKQPAVNQWQRVDLPAQKSQTIVRQISGHVSNIPLPSAQSTLSTNSLQSYHTAVDPNAVAMAMQLGIGM